MAEPSSAAGSFWHQRQVALTGATGFLGFHLTRLLSQAGARVTAVARASSNTARIEALGAEVVRASLGDIPALTKAWQGCEFLFHLAGAVDFQGDWERFRQANVVGTENVLQAAKQAGIRRVVHTSSIVAVAAAARPQMANEATPWDLAPLQVPYVTTKRQAEEAALAANGKGCEVVVVNPASIIGPDDFTQSEFGTLCYRFWKGRIPFYFPGGNNFVDVRDMATGHLLAAQRGRPGERYLLTGENRSYGQFFAELAAVSPRRLWRVPLPKIAARCIGWLNEKFPPKNGGRLYLSQGQAQLLSRYFYFASDKAEKELGYAPRPLKTAIAETYQYWFQPTIFSKINSAPKLPQNSP